MNRSVVASYLVVANSTHLSTHEQLAYRNGKWCRFTYLENRKETKYITLVLEIKYWIANENFVKAYKDNKQCRIEKINS
jgi:hypothetical protein